MFYNILLKGDLIVESLGTKPKQRFKELTEFQAVLFQMQGKDGHGTNHSDSGIHLIQPKVPVPQSIQTRMQNMN